MFILTATDVRSSQTAKVGRVQAPAETCQLTERARLPSVRSGGPCGSADGHCHRLQRHGWRGRIDRQRDRAIGLIYRAARSGSPAHLGEFRTIPSEMRHFAAKFPSCPSCLWQASRTVEDSRRYATRNTMPQLRRRETRPVANENSCRFLGDLSAATPTKCLLRCDLGRYVGIP